MVRRFLIKVLVSALAVWVADYLLAGFAVYGGWQGYIVAGLVLGALNTFIRPILKLLTLPLIMLTLGFFTFVINAGILSLVWATVIISVVNMFFESATDH